MHFTIHNADGSSRRIAPGNSRHFRVTSRSADGLEATSHFDHQHVLAQIPTGELDAFIEWLHVVECDEAIVSDLAAAIREWGRSDLGNTQHYIDRALERVHAAQLAYTTRLAIPVDTQRLAEELTR